MKQNKILNLINIAKKDLKKWLYYADVQNLEEFYKKSEEIKMHSYHTYTEVIDHLSYIKKLESLNV